MTKMFDLSKRVAIITGGAAGIGRAIADGLANAGANVVVCSRNYEKCSEVCKDIADKYKVEAAPFKCDVSNKQDVQEMIDFVMQKFNKIDILVNNAAATSTYDFLDLPESEWDRIIDTNLKGLFLMSQAVSKKMAEAKRGVIINIGSQLGDVARPGKAHYVTTKGGIKQFTKALAIDLGSYGIRVNNLAPGPVNTEFSRPLFSDPAINKEVVTRMPIGRMGEPDDIAGAAVFLASDEASFITGITLPVDGGYLAR